MPEISLAALTERLKDRHSLSRGEAEAAAHLLAEDNGEASVKKDFLCALTAKGETSTEVAGFATAFRQRVRRPAVEPFADRALDVCGTGGDHSGTFNISTVVGFVAAAAGVPVFKHGNRSVTSKCGSADLLEALGFHLEAGADVLRKSLEQLNFAFFFAPLYHPAFKAIAPIRKALAAEGKRTIFNLLGPLINPGNPAHQLVGVFAEEWVGPVADSLHCLGLKRGLVVHGSLPHGGRLDEMSCAGKNHVAGVGALRGIRTVCKATDFGLDPCAAEDLRGGDVQANVECLHELLRGRGPKGLAATLWMNAGTALWVAGSVPSPVKGVRQARKLLSDGIVAAWLKKAQAFYRSTFDF